jgi:hypothetical protein
MRFFFFILINFCFTFTATAGEMSSPLAVAPPIVNEYWELEGKGRELMQDFSTWLMDYRKNGQIIDPQLSERLTELGKGFYELEAKLGGLRRELSITVAGHIQKQAFNEIHGLNENVNYELESFDALILAASDMIVFELVSFIFNAASLEKILVRKLNELEINGETEHFERIADIWLGSERKKEFARTLVFIEKQKDSLDSAYAGGAIYLKSLRERIDTYLAGEIKKSLGFWQQIKDFFYRDFFAYKQNHSKMVNWMEYHLSKIFGNAAGAINWQKYIDSIDPKELERLNTEVLQPGDLIVEKTKGAITDTFIPGYFGHVALYVGRPEQLKELRFKNGSLFLEHPLVKQYLPLLEKGFTTAEAIRSGVKLENISHWVISDLAVLRSETYPEEHLADVLLKTLRYVDSRYDFNFDVNTESIVVCSELPFQVYKGIKFRTSIFSGRHTIGPDDIAVSAGPAGIDSPNRPFQLVYFNYRTKPLSEEEMFEKYLEVLEKDSNYNEVPENNHSYDGLNLLWEAEE